MERRYTRYDEFFNRFNIDLKKYSQDKVESGNKGDYYQMLVNIRQVLQKQKLIKRRNLNQLLKT